MNKKNNKENIIFYHKNCLDGFSCAWICYLKFKNKAVYIGIEPGQNLNLKASSFSKKNIYFCDICPKISDLSFLKKRNNLTIIDHHISNYSIIKKNADKYVFSKNHCASYLAWSYFFKEKKLPKFLFYIDAIDLWNKKIDFFYEILSFLQFQKKEFKLWSKLVKSFENKAEFKKITKEGERIKKIKKYLINEIISNKQLVKFGKYKVYAVNSLFFNSELDEFLLNKKNKFFIVWHQDNEKIKVSLRSIKSFNVAELAKKYGGGGHKNAAGFYIKNLKFPWTKI